MPSMLVQSCEFLLVFGSNSTGLHCGGKAFVLSEYSKNLYHLLVSLMLIWLEFNFDPLSKVCLCLWSFLVSL